jgi:hypothetical protein
VSEKKEKLTLSFDKSATFDSNIEQKAISVLNLVKRVINPIFANVFQGYEGAIIDISNDAPFYREMALTFTLAFRPNIEDEKDNRFVPFRPLGANEGTKKKSKLIQDIQMINQLASGDSMQHFEMTSDAMEVLYDFLPNRLISENNVKNQNEWRRHNLIYEDCSSPNTLQYAPTIGVSRFVTNIQVRGLSLVRFLTAYYSGAEKSNDYVYYASSSFIVPPATPALNIKKMFNVNHPVVPYATYVSLPPTAVINISRGSTEAMKILLDDLGIPYGAFNQSSAGSGIIRV